MTEGNSRSITTNQLGLHEDLDKEVQKHLTSEFKKPFAEFSKQLFSELDTQVNEFMNKGGKGVILDSCCGIGESSFYHAQHKSDYLVIGIDKSEHRLDKFQHHYDKTNNLILARGDLNDLWRLIANANWPISEHFILYPNPWPKAKHLGRRWHGAPVFSYIPKIGGKLTLRSNWDIYVKEFQRALELAGIHCEAKPYASDEAITPFERKYWASGQKSYQLVVEL